MSLQSDGAAIRFSARCGLTNRCTGRRAVPVTVRAIVAILCGKNRARKRALNLAPVS